VDIRIPPISCPGQGGKCSGPQDHYWSQKIFLLAERKKGRKEKGRKRIERKRNCTNK
jgi:hypothetical protein